MPNNPKISVPIVPHFGRVVGITGSGEFFLRVKPVSNHYGARPPKGEHDQYIPLQDIFAAHSAGQLAEKYPP